MGKATEALSKALDNVIDINISEKVGEDNIASQKRRFGIGVCGFADLLANMKIPYGSRRSLEILANCLEVINYSSKKASMELAKEKGKFPFDLRHLPSTAEYIVPGQPAPKLLFDKGNFPARHIVHMKLSAKSEYFAFHTVAVCAVLVLHGEVVAPGENFLFYVQLHSLFLPHLSASSTVFIIHGRRLVDN